MLKNHTRREFITGSMAAAAVLGNGIRAFGKEIGNDDPDLMVKPRLPYSHSALAPYLSEKTLKVHFNDHHITYYNRVKTLIDGPLAQYARLGLGDIIKKSRGGKDNELLLHQMSILLYNHNLYWQSLKPDGGGRPSEKFLGKITGAFGGYDGFRREFIDKATAIGSGWVTLVLSGEALRLARTDYQDTPLLTGDTPLLTLDVWEHAYYLDYNNDRKKYIDTFLDSLINWDYGEMRARWS